MLLTLDRICCKYVTPKDGSDVPEINSVIAGYTKRQDTVFIAAHGVKDIDTKEAVSTESVMCFFSCTKMMTAMAILILWERGIVDLDIPAKKYLPILADFGIIDDGQVDPETGDLKYPPRKTNNESDNSCSIFQGSLTSSPIVITSR